MKIIRVAVRILVITFLILPATSFSLEEKRMVFDDWFSTTPSTNDTRLVHTMSPSGGVMLSYVCAVSRKQCSFKYSTAAACEIGSEVPVLVNIDGHALAVNATCQIVGEAGMTSSFKNDFLVETIFKKNTGNIAIAIPLVESSRFRVATFSLRGARQAITYAERGSITQ